MENDDIHKIEKILKGDIIANENVLIENSNTPGRSSG